MRPAHLLLLVLLMPLRGLAVDNLELNNFITDSLLKQKTTSSGPKLDPKRIINQTNSFLKEREPEMSAAEYALYEKVVTMLASNSEFAVKLLEAMMNEKEPASPAFEFILGNAYYSAGQIDKAEERYRSAVQRYSTFVRAWNNLGVLYYSAGRYTDAIPCFSKSLVLGDRDPTTFGLLGYSLESGGNYVSAEMAFMQALGGDPANTDWKEGLLRICIEGKQYARAESLVKNLIKDHPQETRYWLTYANILLSENRKLEAIALLESAAGTGVAGAEELNLLGDLYAGQNLAAEALTVYQKLLARSSEMGERKLLGFAQMLISTRKLSEAQTVLDSLKLSPTSDNRVPFLQARADMFAAQKQWPAARQEIEALLKLSPFDGRALLSLGRTHAEENDLERAAFAFENAYRITATTYLASLELANLELKNRHYSKCVQYLQKALSIEKTDAVEDYLSRVKTLVVNDD
jgi:tetratricopeptide (TPR) repeat protein